MGDPRGFLKLGRKKADERPVEERLRGYAEFVIEPAPEALREQAARCMDCGIPFCHKGCPLANLIPEWNDHLYRGDLAAAARALLSTNNFPEVTGRVCPAPCEAACVLSLHNAPVAIKDIERSLGMHDPAASFAPRPSTHPTGKHVAIVGSGPAGLAAAQQLARLGHVVTVFEKSDRIGGLLRYGIPDFKLEKSLIDQRLAQLSAEGVRFQTGVDVGASVSFAELRKTHDALVIAVGASLPRDLQVPGRELSGVHFAMTYLAQQNAAIADSISGGRAPEGGACGSAKQPSIHAAGKRVVVIGGGDTGSDCVGTALRQGAASVTQLELMPAPPSERAARNPWPEWPLVLRTSSSQEEGAERTFQVQTQRFFASAEGTSVAGLTLAEVEFRAGKLIAAQTPPHDIEADLVLLAMGFVGAEPSAGLGELGVLYTDRGTVATNAAGATAAQGVFAAGDAYRGPSLVVWAIADGRRVAESVDRYLKGYALA